MDRLQSLSEDREPPTDRPQRNIVQSSPQDREPYTIRRLRNAISTTPPYAKPQRFINLYFFSLRSINRDRSASDGFGSCTGGGLLSHNDLTLRRRREDLRRKPLEWAVRTVRSLGEREGIYYIPCRHCSRYRITKTWCRWFTLFRSSLSRRSESSCGRTWEMRRSRFQAMRAR